MWCERGPRSLLQRAERPWSGPSSNQLPAEPAEGEPSGQHVGGLEPAPRLLPQLQLSLSPLLSGPAVARQPSAILRAAGLALASVCGPFRNSHLSQSAYVSLVPICSDAVRPADV